MMKLNIILLFLLSATSLMAQVDTLTVAHDHNLVEKKCDGAKCKYFVDNRQVNQAEYEKHINEPSIASCTPCYLKQLDDKGTSFLKATFIQTVALEHTSSAIQMEQSKSKDTIKFQHRKSAEMNYTFRDIVDAMASGITIKKMAILKKQKSTKMVLL